MSVFCYQVYQAKIKEHLLNCQTLLSDSTCVPEAEPGKLDIKRREPGILFICLPIVGSTVAQCLTQDLGSTGSSLAGVTALWSLSKTVILD